ncbi:unnamed protein product, partial [Heterosigma akashiwo]
GARRHRVYRRVLAWKTLAQARVRIKKAEQIDSNRELKKMSVEQSGSENNTKDRNEKNSSSKKKAKYTELKKTGSQEKKRKKKQTQQANNSAGPPQKLEAVVQMVAANGRPILPPPRDVRPSPVATARSAHHRHPPSHGSTFHSPTAS